MLSTSGKKESAIMLSIIVKKIILSIEIIYIFFNVQQSKKYKKKNPSILGDITHHDAEQLTKPREFSSKWSYQFIQMNILRTIKCQRLFLEFWWV